MQSSYVGYNTNNQISKDLVNKLQIEASGYFYLLQAKSIPFNAKLFFFLKLPSVSWDS